MNKCHLYLFTLMKIAIEQPHLSTLTQPTSLLYGYEYHKILFTNIGHTHNSSPYIHVDQSFLIYFEVRAKLVKKWLVCVLHLEPINNVLMLLVTT